MRRTPAKSAASPVARTTAGARPASSTSQRYATPSTKLADDRFCKAAPPSVGTSHLRHKRNWRAAIYARGEIYSDFVTAGGFQVPSPAGSIDGGVILGTYSRMRRYIGPSGEGNQLASLSLPGDAF
jgi:hypothetical protein